MSSKNLSGVLTTPQSVEAIDRLVHGGLILGCLALSDLVDRRLRWLAYGAAGFMAASAFTGWTPASLALGKTKLGKSPKKDEPGSGESDMEQAIPSFGRSELRPEPRNGHHDAIRSSSLGVPHRIPIEAVLTTIREERIFAFDADDRPAPSPDGDLGLAD